MYAEEKVGDPLLKKKSKKRENYVTTTTVSLFSLEFFLAFCPEL